MDIGSEFDDDFFEKPREKRGNKPTNYEPKVYVPLWYMDSHKGSRDDDILISLKHQADFHYYSRNYAKAAEAYEKCLQKLPSSNTTWKREFMENLSRSFLHLGKPEKALEWSLKLDESSCSADQKIVAMNLLATVCHKLGKYQEELEALHCCIESHKSCPEFWLRLGLCYAGLFKIDLPGSSLLKSSLEDRDPCCAFNTKSPCQIKQSEKIVNETSSLESAIASTSSSSTCTKTYSLKGNDTTKCELCSLGIQIVSSCLIHTKVLLESGGPNLLGVQKDEKLKEKIAASLEYMEVDESFIEIASTMLGSDFLSGFQESRNNLEDPEKCLKELKASEKVLRLENE